MANWKQDDQSLEQQIEDLKKVAMILGAGAIIGFGFGKYIGKCQAAKEFATIIMESGISMVISPTARIM